MSNPEHSQICTPVASIQACRIDVTDFASNTLTPEQFRALAAGGEMTIIVHDPERFAELLALARQAVESVKARKDEDVQEWARRLANDVGHLAD